MVRLQGRRVEEDGGNNSCDEGRADEPPSLHAATVATPGRPLPAVPAARLRCWRADEQGPRRRGLPVHTPVRTRQESQLLPKA
jgi:hypothetical protein